jgi:hypothetical protein
MTNNADNDFFRRLTLLGPKKLTMARVKFVFADTYPELADRPDRIEALHTQLCSLESAGLVRFPSPKNRRAWLGESSPKLPRWIVLNTKIGAVERIDASQVSWLPELGFCADLKVASLIELAVTVNNFLINNRRTLLPVPVRERSLQIFGDEKRLDSLVQNGGLFGGKLPLSAIGAFEVEPPLAHELSGVNSKPVLVIENHHTFWSFCRWNARDRQYSAIIYGGGNAFVRAGKPADELMKRLNTDQMEYFGDLDLAGIEIPWRFNQMAQQQGLAITAAPAIGLYEWLLAHGVRRDAVPIDKPASLSLLDWLSAALANGVRELFLSGKWIPQESLGTESLARYFSKDCSNQ